MVEIAHERRTRCLAGDLAGWTAHVDVDDVGALGLGDSSALAHPVWIGADELYNEWGKTLPFGAAEHVPALGHQLGAGDHFRDHQARPKAMRQLAKWQIAHPGHRSEYDGILKLLATDTKRRRHWGSPLLPIE